MTSATPSPTSPSIRLDLDLGDFERLRIAEIKPDGPIEDDELERFRNQWKTEVQTKQRDGSITKPGPGKRKEVEKPQDEPDIAEKTVTLPVRLKVSPVKATRRLSIHLDELPVAGPRTPLGTAFAHKPIKLPPRVVARKDEAVQLYAKAVEREQTGQLSEALMLYRKAFKLDGSSLPLQKTFT